MLTMAASNLRRCAKSVGELGAEQTIDSDNMHLIGDLEKTRVQPAPDAGRIEVCSAIALSSERLGDGSIITRSESQNRTWVSRAHETRLRPPGWHGGEFLHVKPLPLKDQPDGT